MLRGLTLTLIVMVTSCVAVDSDSTKSKALSITSGDVARVAAGNTYMKVSRSQSPNFFTVLGSGSFTLTAVYRSDVSPIPTTTWRVFSNCSEASIAPSSVQGNTATFQCQLGVGANGAPFAAIAEATSSAGHFHRSIVTMNSSHAEKECVPALTSSGLTYTYSLNFGVIPYAARLPGDRTLTLTLDGPTTGAGTATTGNASHTQSQPVPAGATVVSVDIADGLNESGNLMLGSGTFTVNLPRKLSSSVKPTLRLQ